jgi:hypothetical protein
VLRLPLSVTSKHAADADNMRAGRLFNLYQSGRKQGVLSPRKSLYCGRIYEPEQSPGCNLWRFWFLIVKISEPYKLLPMCYPDNQKGLGYSPNPLIFWSGKRDSNPRPSAWEDAINTLHFISF